MKTRIWIGVTIAAMSVGCATPQLGSAPVARDASTAGYAVLAANPEQSDASAARSTGERPGMTGQRQAEEIPAVKGRPPELEKPGATAQPPIEENPGMTPQRPIEENEGRPGARLPGRDGRRDNINVVRDIDRLVDEGLRNARPIDVAFIREFTPLIDLALTNCQPIEIDTIDRLVRLMELARRQGRALDPSIVVRIDRLADIAEGKRTCGAVVNEIVPLLDTALAAPIIDVALLDRLEPVIELAIANNEVFEPEILERIDRLVDRTMPLHRRVDNAVRTRVGNLANKVKRHAGRTATLRADRTR